VLEGVPRLEQLLNASSAEVTANMTLAIPIAGDVAAAEAAATRVKAAIACVPLRLVVSGTEVQAVPLDAADALLLRTLAPWKWAAGAPGAAVGGKRRRAPPKKKAAAAASSAAAPTAASPASPSAAEDEAPIVSTGRVGSGVRRRRAASTRVPAAATDAAPVFSLVRAALQEAVESAPPPPAAPAAAAAAAGPPLAPPPHPPSPFAAVFHLDKAALVRRGMLPADVGRVLASLVGVHALVTWSGGWEAAWDVRARVACVGPAPAPVDQCVSEALASALLEHVTLRGTAPVRNVIAARGTRVGIGRRAGDAIVLSTDGSALRAALTAMAAEGLPPCATSSNVPEVTAALGVEAGATLMAAELQAVMDKEGLDPRHTALLADTMFASGAQLPFTRHALSKMGASMLSCAAFEQTLTVLETAAAEARVDPLGGATERQMLGQPVHVGTGVVSVRAPLAAAAPPAAEGGDDDGDGVRTFLPPAAEVARRAAARRVRGADASEDDEGAVLPSSAALPTATAAAMDVEDEGVVLSAAAAAAERPPLVPRDDEGGAFHYDDDDGALVLPAAWTTATSAGRFDGAADGAASAGHEAAVVAAGVDSSYVLLAAAEDDDVLVITRSLEPAAAEMLRGALQAATLQDGGRVGGWTAASPRRAQVAYYTLPDGSGATTTTEALDAPPRLSVEHAAWSHGDAWRGSTGVACSRRLAASGVPFSLPCATAVEVRREAAVFVDAANCGWRYAIVESWRAAGVLGDAAEAAASGARPTSTALEARVRVGALRSLCRSAAAAPAVGDGDEEVAQLAALHVGARMVAIAERLGDAI